MKKRLLALVLSMVMTLGLLAGCGENSRGDGTSDGDDLGSTPGNSISPSGDTIRVWIPPYASSDAELTDQAFWDAQFDAFEAENNCTVEVTIVPWDGYKQEVTAGLISGQGPDVVYIDTPYDLVEAGAFEQLDSYFTANEKQDYLYWDLGQILGQQYVMPMMVGNACVLYCNMDILNQAGFDRPPETWNELVEYCLAIKEKVSGVDPFLQSWGDTGKGVLMVGFLPFYWQTGESFLDDMGHPSINNAGGLVALEFLKGLQDKGIFDEPITAMDTPRDCFREGTLAMYIGDTGGAKQNTEAGINWEAISSLEGPTGIQATWIAADSLAIASNSSNKELAAKAMKYMLSAPVMDAFHEQMYAMCPITKDARYYDDEQFQSMYVEQADIFHNWPAFANSDVFYDYLLENIKSMFMGELSPQQVLDDTMKQYETFVS